MIQFTVFGAPVAQPRARYRNVPGKSYPIAVSNPRKAPITQWKYDVKMSFLEAGHRLQDGFPVGALAVHIRYYLPRPARLMRAKDPDGAIPHTGRPDVDNLTKAIFDALNGVAWKDDGQVSMTTMCKHYHEKWGKPRAEIRIEEL